MFAESLYYKGCLFISIGIQIGGKWALTLHQLNILVKRTKVQSIYWGKFAQGPIQIVTDMRFYLFSQCTTRYEIWDNFNFPMLNPHWQLCKYGPHLLQKTFS